MAEGMAAGSQELLARRALGRSGLTVTRLMLGGGPIGGLFAPVDDDTAQATLQAAWSAGVRAFDTAPHYGAGLSELRLGESWPRGHAPSMSCPRRRAGCLFPRAPRQATPKASTARRSWRASETTHRTASGRPWRLACGGSVSTALTWLSSTTRMTTLRRPSKAPTRRWRSSGRRASSVRSVSA